MKQQYTTDQMSLAYTSGQLQGLYAALTMARAHNLTEEIQAIESKADVLQRRLRELAGQA
jgi:uncharacterized protein Yka (UPF0111/DUF47 family)